MNCRICGTPINVGEKFCSLCGEKIESYEEIQQSQVQQAYVTQPDNRQAYSRQAYGRQPDNRQQYVQQPDNRPQSYGQQYGGHSSGNMYYSVSGRSRKGLWITLSLIAVLAVAAVLVFNVFGNKQALSQVTASQKTLPFKGDTVQTKLANDTAKVIYDALGIFGDVGIDTNELAEQPFDMKLDMTIEAMKEKVKARMDMAYDNETFGMNISTGGISGKAQYIEDIMYVEVYGQVFGLDLHSTKDLSQPMTLKDRVAALGFYAQSSPSGENDYLTFAVLLIQSTISGGDNNALAEALINSINESCFERSGSKTTLTLHADDISAALRTFAKKLDSDEEIKRLFEGYIKGNKGTSTDVVKQINDAADTLDEQKETENLELAWEVSYKKEKPVSFEIKAKDGDEEYVYSFGYEKDGDSTHIMFELTPGSSSPGVSGACNFKKVGPGTDIEGSIITQGQLMTFYGNITFSGNNTHGTITMNVPNSYSSTNAQAAGITIDFNLTINIGMPGTKVKDDGRFKIDTSGASIIDGSSILGKYGLPGT